MDSNIEKAKAIISEIIYITIATSSKDGQPWNTPVYSAFDQEHNFYWASDQNGQHSKNIRENSNVFLAIYNSTVPEGTGEGVYVKAVASELSDPDEITKALSFLYSRKNKVPRDAKEFIGHYPRRVYKAVPEKFWINGAGNVNGNYIDIRVEVDLLNINN